MGLIRKNDLIETIRDGLQYISYYHPVDYITSLTAAYEREESPAAKDAMKQILVNSRLCALGKRPICQDTGIVVVFLYIGMEISWDFSESLDAVVNEAVRQAYLLPDNVLRQSIVADPAGKRINTGDNTPANVHIRLVPGNKIDIHIAAKGGGSENKSKFAMLNPSDSIVDWVIETVPTMGAGWCPPGMLGIGIGGTAEKAMLLAKESLMETINIQDLIARGPRNTAESLRIELYQKINGLGIGAQGLGGLTTVLDVKVKDFPCHAASKPIAMIPNCAATRHAHMVLEPGKGAVSLPAPDLTLWPDLDYSDSLAAKKINVNELTHDQVASWKIGDTLLLSGTILTGRDAAHKRIQTMLENGEPLPVDFKDKLIYYVGPVDPVRDEIVGPAGPTTATRMDKFTEMMLAKTGLLGMIGKAERGPEARESIKRHQSVYLIAIGGAAYLVAQAIKKSKVVAFEELGMEAIHEFEVENMPVTVAVDSSGESVHERAPAIWREKMKS